MSLLASLWHSRTASAHLRSRIFIAFAAAFSLLPIGAANPRPQSHPSSQVTFYKDVLPILQDHCQACHRQGEVAPMPLQTYQQTKPWAAAIRQQVASRQMPPWFADPRYGKFSNDPSLTAEQIATLAKWVDEGARQGSPKEAPPAKNWSKGWNIDPPDKVISMPKPVSLPASGDIEYTYEIVPTGFTHDMWVRESEAKPSSPEHVHHAVVYIRPPNSDWLRSAPVGVPFVASDFKDPKMRAEAHETTSDMLLVYAPGSLPDHWPATVAKFIPAGSDLVFQMHYTSNGHAATDQTSVGMVFAKEKPAERVLTLQLTNHSFIIPPRTDDYRVDVAGTIPNDCTLLSFFPHMHLRGKRFEYNILNPDGTVKETLLRVNYNFHWQLSYKLAQPRFLKAGSWLQAVAWYDNSDNNPHNPDPNAVVTWGGQTYDEMMVGFFDVAVPADVNKEEFFVRHKPAGSK